MAGATDSVRRLCIYSRNGLHTAVGDRWIVRVLSCKYQGYVIFVSWSLIAASDREVPIQRKEIAVTMPLLLQLK